MKSNLMKISTYFQVSAAEWAFCKGSGVRRLSGGLDMARGKAVLFVACLLAGIVAGWGKGGKAALAAHFDNDVSDLAAICYDCHTLNAGLADDNTSFINASARTLPTMRQRNGGLTPATLGCTFCHNDPTRTTNMKTAVGPFDGKASQHPVDRPYSKDSYSNVSLGINTYTTLYLSNWDNTWAVPSSQIGCVDCHDTAGAAYPNHPRMDNAVRAANPFMLRGGAASWSAADNHASNAFCLQVCHGRSAAAPSGWRMGHVGWGSYDNTYGGMPDNTLKEHDGTPLKTSKCVDCHETHSSSVKPDLMGENRQSLQNIDPANCTNICHQDSVFLSRGHGKTGISLVCANCHNASVSHRDLSNPKRLTGGEAPAKASLAQNFASNGIDDNFDGVIDDSLEAALQYSAESNCSATCHSDKHVHQGTIGSTSGSASCLHCHDPHGKGVDNNIKMVRRTVMGRATNYWTSGVDLFRGDNTSICDNPNCHAKPLGNTSTPGTILGDVQEHKDANVGAGTVCTSCHNHSSTTGGSSFAPVCNSCHTYPGQPFIAGTHVLSGVHDKHVAASDNGGYALPCSTCHYKYSHNQSGVNNAGEWAQKFQSLYVNVKFDGLWNPKNANGPTYAGVAADNTLADNVWAPGVGGTGRCDGLYCHGNSADAVAWSGNGATGPRWDNTASGACGTCHRATAAAPPQTFAHAKHADNTAQGYGISCGKCHYETTADGVTVTNRAAHLNRESRVVFDSTDPLVASGAYSGTITVGDSGTTVGQCSNIYCHSPGYRLSPPFDNGAAGAPDWKQAGPLSCTACHGAAGQSGIRAGMPAYANGSPKINTHPKHLDDKFGCQVCHFATTTDGATIASRANHVNGAYNVTNDNLARHAFTYSSPNCSAAVCHGGATSGVNMPAWGQTTGLPFGCDVCHMNSGGSLATADVDQYAYDNGMAKVRAADWYASGHGATAAYPSGNPAANGGTGTKFNSCTTNCHTASVGHDNAVDFFRLRTYSGIVDFSDANTDPAAQQNENRLCLDCHSATGANASQASVRVEQNHYGTWAGNKHTASTMGGTFCFDCHDPHGDANHYMIHDNVTKTSDGVYGKPVTAVPTTFSKTNQDGAAGLDNVYDWGDYVKSTSPYTGLCQTCHAASGGALYFNSATYTAAHNKTGSPPQRCTVCHSHNQDFSPSCNSCHGEASFGTGAPPFAPWSGNRIWPTTVDNYANLAGVGNHRSSPSNGIAWSSHDPFVSSTAGCSECHTDTPGSGSTHNQATNDNAVMTNIANHTWTGAGGPLSASWSGGALAGAVAGGSVTDDGCSNIDCHSPYYNANAYKSGTPFPYTRYWINASRWDCYTCHAYDGNTASSRPSKDNMTTGSHGAHVYSWGLACTTCHVNNAGNLNHKDGLVQVPINGVLGPVTLAGTYATTPAMPQPPTDNVAPHRSWGTCSNVYCHSDVQKNNPDGLPNDNLTYATPQWGGGSASVVCGSCHKAGVTHSSADNIATGSHSAHLAVALKVKPGTPCLACHWYPEQTADCNGCHVQLGGYNATRHSDGLIDVRFAGSLGSVVLSGIFDNNGDHVNDNAIVPGMPYGTCESVYCHGTGTPVLTGGANQAATPNVPRWGAPSTGLCGSCHGGPGGSTNYPGKASNYPTSGSHARHMSDAAGPMIAACTDCHTSNAAGTHVDGKTDLRTSSADNTATTLALTQVCNPCHASGVFAAKANWASAAQLDCLTCHMTGSLANARADNTGIFAPDVGGDNSTYGAASRGHNRATASGAYPVTGNPAANLACGTCHDTASQHVNNVNDNTYAGNRLLATVNGVSGLDNSTKLCKACHATTGASPATKKNVNSHGNAGYSGRLESVFAELECGQCHEPHGMVYVGTGTQGVNIWMINPTITVRAGTTVSPVRFFAKVGANSFNEYDPGAGNELNASLYNADAADQLCVVCHANSNNAGYPMTRNIAGRHNAPGYTGNEAGKDCSGCHSHNQDGAIGTVDGLMPLACNACHSYPGVSGGTYTKTMSAVHGKHVGTPSGIAGSRAYECTLCHYNYTHNQNGVTAGAAWPPTYYTYVNIDFDPAWNPSNANGPTYNGAAVPTVGNGGTGTCAGLYCHGNNATLSAGWGGSATQPKWDNTVAVSCGACHDTGTADTTPGTVFSTKNHPAHLGAAYGPGLAAFSGGGTCSEGTGCHTKYGRSPTATHANNAKDLRSTATDNGEAAAVLATTQVCRNCHSPYASSAGTGDTLVRTQANWDNVSYKVPCITCHNASAGQQGTQNLNGGGDKAPNVEAAWSANGHGASSIDNAATTTDSGAVDQVPPVRCETCHDEAGQHIGTAKDATNPWRLDNALTRYASTGGLDDYCLNQCHAATGPARHAWIVTGIGAASKDNAVNTHPTSTAVVPTSPVDKSRWFRIPTDTAMPVAADLATKTPPARGNGSLVACVTCHDPHGVGTALVSARTFSGVNDNGYKMLRYKASGVAPTPLCAKCHK